MAIDTSILEQDLIAVIGDLSVTMTFKGSSIIGMVGAVSNSEESGILGIAQGSGVEFSSCTSRFATTPKPKDTCTIDGINYKVDGVQVSADGIQTILTLTKETASVNI